MDLKALTAKVATGAFPNCTYLRNSSLCERFTTLTGPKTTPLSKPTPKAQFLVNSDVEPGDLLGVLVWDASTYDTRDKWAIAHVILRHVAIADENEDGHRTAFFLHSWAVPVRQKLTILSRRVGRHSIYESSSKMRARGGMGQLKLHYRDALIPLLLNHYPLQSLLYSNSLPNSGGMNFASRVEDPEGFEDLLEEGVGSEDSRDEYMYGYSDDDSDAGSWRTSEGSD